MGPLPLLAVLVLAAANPVSQDLKQTEKRLQRHRRLLQRLEQDSARILEILAELDRQRHELDERQRQAAAALEQGRQRLFEMLERRHATVHLLAVTRADLASRLRTIYKRGRFGWLDVLLSAADLDQALQRVRWLHRRSRTDARLVRRLERLADNLRQDEQQLQNEARKQRRRLERLRRQARQLLALRDEQHRLLQAIEQRASWQRRVLGELARSRRRLLAVLRTLQSRAGSAGSGMASWRGRLPPPVRGARIEVPFGLQKDARFGTVTRHQGIDLRAPQGSPVRAVFPGQVVFADWFEGYGLLVILEHGGGFYTLYAHLDRLLVKRGQQVSQGQQLGGLGDSGSLKGPFLYFEIRRGSRALDPARWLRF